MSPDPIFEPLAFRNLTVKNRIFRSNISGRFDNEDGSLTQTRINWECRFAAGGVGAVISSYVPVRMDGRIIAGYATIHRDDFIPLWQKLGEAVRANGACYILQLSHSGRQMDIPGVHNMHRHAPAPTSQMETLHGFLCQAMSTGEVRQMVQDFAKAAWRAREAGLDGIELHAANGYLFTQFLSSGINDRKDAYGGSLRNRARFLLEVIEAIRDKVGRDFHLQVKLSATDHNNVIPWEGKGNTVSDTLQVAQWCEAAGVDALHISTGSLFPHPLNPPGDLPLEVLAVTYDTMISSGVHGFRNFLLFRHPTLRPIFRWLWFRMKKGRPIEGVGFEEARLIRQNVGIPVISTGGWQNASAVRDALQHVDGISIARSLVANPNLVEYWRAGYDLPPKPCNYCNRCLVGAAKLPMGCHQPSRFASREAMVEQLMEVYETKPELQVPKHTMAPVQPKPETTTVSP